MQKNSNIFKKIATLFFLSGFAALSYQIVWTRLLLYIFGNTTYSVVVVLAAFMAGLGLGGYFFGKLSATHKYPLRLFAYIELCIGLSAIAFPAFIKIIDTVYISVINLHLIQSGLFLIIIKFILTSIIILPITTLMGGTFPLVLQHFAKVSQNHSRLTGSLYAYNTLGAIFGAFVTAFISIEIFGLIQSLYLTSGINFLIFFQLLKSPSASQANISKSLEKKQSVAQVNKLNRKTTLVIALYGLSGITSMALEVLWIRLLTPIVGTYIYAFSLILIIFLSGLASGSWFYKQFIKKLDTPFNFLGVTLAMISLSAFFSVVVSASGIIPALPILQTLGVVLPGTFAMGLILPAITTLSEKRNLGPFIGKALLSNCIGSTLGPILAGFLLIPFFGTTRSILVIATFTSILAILLFRLEKTTVKHLKGGRLVPSKVEGDSFQVGIFTSSKLMNSVQFGCISLVCLLTIIIISGQDRILRPRFIKHQIFLHQDAKVLYLEDEVASVLAYSSNNYKNRGLIIDGVETTRLVPETKLIGHLPLLIHPNPKQVLIIALGMGSTFKSSLTHAVEQVDVVELVPSVAKTFYLFHADGKLVLNDPRGKIIINDGRQFVHTTKNTYDVVTIDPPPPVNSAGTTVLYSQEFYQDIKKILNPGAVVQQWFFFDTTTQEHELKNLLKSFVDEFPYGLVFSSPNKLGISLIATTIPYEYNEKNLAKKLERPNVLADLSEWENTPKNAQEFTKLYIGTIDVLKKYVDTADSVTDNEPRSEYFLMQRILHPSPFIDNMELTDRLYSLVNN